MVRYGLLLVSAAMALGCGASSARDAQPPSGSTAPAAAPAQPSSVDESARRSETKGSGQAQAAPVRFDEDAQMYALIKKALKNEVSRAELRMLKGICMNRGHRVCRSLAVGRTRQYGLYPSIDARSMEKLQYLSLKQMAQDGTATVLDLRILSRICKRRKDTACQQLAARRMAAIERNRAPQERTWREQRNALVDKMILIRGKQSEAELRKLEGLCTHLSDTPCVYFAMGELERMARGEQAQQWP